MKTFRERVDSVKIAIADAWADKDRVQANSRFEALVSNTGGSYLAAPETLQAVAEVSPIKTDLFDTGRFYRARKNEKVLDRVVKENSVGYAPFSCAAQHVWSALISQEPATQDCEGEKPAWYATHAKVMAAMLEMPEFATLRERTVGSALYTSAAMHSILPAIRALIDEELPPEQKEGDGDGDGEEDPNGKPKPGQKPGNSKKNMQAKMREAMREAKTNNDKADTALKGCGVEPPTDMDMDPSEYMALVREFQENQKMRKMVDMVGRMGRIARAKAKRIIPGFAGYGTKRFLGDELHRVPDYKIAELGVSALRKTFLLEMCGAELPQVTEHDNAPPGRGPVVVMTDESGSMQEGQHMIAKALAVASIRTAKEHHRKAWGISFANDARLHDTGTPVGLGNFMKSNMGGGTAFNAPLGIAMEHIGTCTAARQSDMMLLTDGESDISDDFLKKFATWKYRTGARLFVVMIGAGGGYGSKTDASNLKKVADSYINVNSLTDEKAAASAFGDFWTKIGDGSCTHEELDERAEASDAEAVAGATGETEEKS